MSNLFDLNDRIFAAMDELDVADNESLDQAIEKAKVKTQLFATAINNANTIARISQMQDRTMDGLAMQIGTSRMLLGQPQLVAQFEERPQLPVLDAVKWVRENAGGHTATWIRDRLGKACGASYSFEEIASICEEAGVEPVKLDCGTDLRTAESDSYGLHGPAKGYAR